MWSCLENNYFCFQFVNNIQPTSVVKMKMTKKIVETAKADANLNITKTKNWCEKVENNWVLN